MNNVNSLLPREASVDNSGTKWRRGLLALVCVVGLVGLANNNRSQFKTGSVATKHFQASPPCNPGSFLNSTNQCEKCASGSYTATAGQNSCTVCGTGPQGGVTCNSHPTFVGMTGCICSTRYGFSGLALSLEAAKDFISRYGCVGVGSFIVSGWGGETFTYRCFVDETNAANPLLVTESSLFYFSFVSSEYHSEFQSNGVQAPFVAHGGAANGASFEPLNLVTFGAGSGIMFYYPFGPNVAFDKSFQSWSTVTNWVAQYRQMGRVGYVPRMKMQFRMGTTSTSNQLIVFTPLGFHMPASGSYIIWHYSTRGISGREIAVSLNFDSTLTLSCAFTARPPPSDVSVTVQSPSTATVDSLVFLCDTTVMFYV